MIDFFDGDIGYSGRVCPCIRCIPCFARTGGYELEEHAAEAYDVAALKCKGQRVKTNFSITRYGWHNLCPHTVGGADGVHAS